MSNHGHHQRKPRKKNPIDAFLDRLRGSRSKKHYHRSEFPGINLPKDYDPVAWKDQSRHARRPSGLVTEEPADSEPDMDISASVNPVNVEDEASQVINTKKKNSIREKYKLYLQKKEQQREQRYKEKLRRKHRQKAEEERRKRDSGPGLAKTLFSFGEAGAEAGQEKALPWYSKRHPAFRNLTITLNSTMIFITTYILTYLFYWLTCMLVASFYGLDSILYYYDLQFNDHSPLWNRLNILVVTGVPPFLCLGLALFLIQVVFKVNRFAGLQKLFILWSAYHLFNHFFGAFPSGIVTDEGFGYVAAWLYLNTAFKFMFSLISLFILAVIGHLTTKHVLETSDSMHRIKGDHRLSFIFYQMALPWLIGTVIMLILREPKNFDYPYETLMFFSMAFIVFPAFFNAKVKAEPNLLKSKKKRRINYGYITMTVMLLLFLRLVLDIGLHFIIEINISISPANI